MAQSLALLGYIALLKENYVSARSMEEEALTLFREVGDATGIAYALENLASVLALQGEYGKAQALLEESLDVSKLRGNMWIRAIGLVGLSSVAAAQKEFVRATRLMSASEAARESIDVQLPSLVQALYDSTMTTTIELLGERAYANAWSEGKAMTLEQILSATEKEPMVMPTHISDGFLTEHPAKLSPLYPDGLTAREVEVLCLVAQGLTDAQIAEQLIISKRTVNWHLTTIYSKIQVSSRSAATRYAIEHHLL